MQPLEWLDWTLSYAIRIKMAGAYHHIAKRAIFGPETTIMLAHEAINIELIIS